MTTEQIRYFIAAAETLNFTLAAERLFTAQSALSRQIAALEGELGVKLFHRSNNVLALTQVGHFFYERVLKLYDDYQTIVEETQKLSIGVKGHLNIGLQEDQLINSKLTRAAHDLMVAHPHAEINIRRGSYAELVDQLDKGALDVIQLIIYAGLYQSIYCILPLSVEPMCLAVNRNYLTVQQDKIERMQIPQVIAPYPIALMTTTAYPEIVRHDLPAINDSNVHYVDSTSSIPLYLDTGIAVSIINRNNIVRLDPKIQTIPIEGISPVTQGVVWCRSNTNPLHKQLIDMIKGLQN